MPMRTVVLRLGHRPERDKRSTTHVGLTARALGAEGMLIDSQDEKLEGTIRDVVERWGGDFYVESGVNWKRAIKRWKREGGKVAHLTMYGLNLPTVETELRVPMLMVVVGAEKVPAEIYRLADWNVAVGHQPHSEIAALAVTLNRVMGDDPLEQDFGGQIRIIPSERGKRVEER